jgi:hypothetical protein
LGTSYQVEFSKGKNKKITINDFASQRTLNINNSIDGSVVSNILKNRNLIIDAAYSRVFNKE